jgi:membrane-associated phospholipid phosphatase
MRCQQNAYGYKQTRALHPQDIPMSLVFLIALLLAGLTGTSRLYLKAHTPAQVYAGYFIGILTQFIALRFIP